MEHIKDLLGDLYAEKIEEAIDIPQEEWRHNCHAVSLAIVKSDLTEGPRRVARGTVDWVASQHSWVVLGNDCYDSDATIIDATLWSYRPEVPVVYIGTVDTYKHRPHGAGSIWTYGRPHEPTGKIIELGGALSREARDFLDMLGPLDLDGWSVLLHAPVEGWPSKEIITAACANPKLRSFVPVDIEGMVTDNNPYGLYLP